MLKVEPMIHGTENTTLTQGYIPYILKIGVNDVSYLLRSVYIKRMCNVPFTIYDLFTIV